MIEVMVPPPGAMVWHLSPGGGAVGMDHAAGFRSRRDPARPGKVASETDEAHAGKYRVKRQVRGPLARIQSRTMHQG